MARHYYLTRSGRLRRKDNTLMFEPSAEPNREAEPERAEADEEIITAGEAEADGMGDLSLEPEGLIDDSEAGAQDAARGEYLQETEPMRVRDRRVIPIEDVDALWVFRELELNARVINFLAQHKVPVHFFNYYGFYSGSFYPREYLNAGYLLVEQVRHYTNKRLRLQIAREFIHSALHNILRNLRYYATRGLDLEAETGGVQVEMLRLAEVENVEELMACEGRARSSYYQGFSKILRERAEFTRRVRRPPDNPVNALISFTNGLVYAATLTQIYRTQLNPTISFLHEPGARRFSLALDLSEVFKPILADRLIFKIINNRQLSERDFAQDLNCCYLKESGRKTILKEWDGRLQTTIEHRRLRRKVSYERLIRLECYKLVKHVTNVEPYVGFRAWW
jgi:CRISP-associated protein Cas1